MINLSQYYYFFEIVRVGSIRKAAETLFISPSALSRHIQRLEHIHKATLFSRSTKGMELTDVGKLVFKYAESILNDQRILVNQINDIKNLEKGSLSYSSIEGVISSIVLPTIAHFHQQYPNIHFNGKVGASAEVYQHVADGVSDFGIAFKEQNDKEIEIVSSFHTNIIAVANNELFSSHKDTKISLKQLQKFPLVLLTPEFYTRQLLDIVGRKQGVSLSAQFETEQIETLKQMIYNHGYVSVLPACSVQKELLSGSLHSLHITGLSSKKINTVIIQKRNQYKSKSVTHFLEYLMDEVKNLY